MIHSFYSRFVDFIFGVFHHHRIKQQVMEITRENFEESLPKLVSAIHEAHFISYDFEFTGLFTEKERGVVDDPSERYERNRRQCVKFLPVQFGFCTFKYNEMEGSYDFNPFSIYLFPHSLESMAFPDKCFMLQTSSIDFLVQHKFDFNKAFYHGVGFASTVEIEEKKSNIDKYFKKLCENMESDMEPLPIPKQWEDFLEEKHAIVQDFISKQPTPEEELILKDLNSYQRKMLHTHLPRWNKFLSLESEYSTSDGHYLVVKNCGDANNKRAELEKQREKMKKEAEKNAGFSKVIAAISESKALLIGHNQGIDLLHTLHHFIAPLPKSYNEFKTFATSTFPRLVDTKYLAKSELLNDYFPSTSLSQVFEKTESSPFKPIKLNKVMADSCDKSFHDAAYDAYCTGRTFLSMMEFLGAMEEVENVVENVDQLMQPFYHRIPIMDSMVISHWNLGGDDEILDRSSFYHASFPSAWKTDDLKQAFSSLCSDVKQIRICWIDSEHAWIRLNEDHAEEDVENLSNSTTPFFVCSYHQFKKRSMPLEEPIPKKRRVYEKTKESNTTPTESFDVPDEW